MENKRQQGGNQAKGQQAKGAFKKGHSADKRPEQKKQAPQGQAAGKPAPVVAKIDLPDNPVAEELQAIKAEAKVESLERKGRIFIKNLVFDTNEKMLRKLCTPFGEIKEVSIPVDPSTNRPRGFAFIEFVSKNSALKAVGTLDQSAWKGRTITASLSVDKRRYQVDANAAAEPEPEPVPVPVPVVAAPPKSIGGIEIVPLQAADKPGKKAKAKAKPVPVEEPVEDTAELDELDAIVMRNIQAMGDDFGFDEEDPEDPDDEPDAQSEPRAMVEELDIPKATAKSNQKEKILGNVDKLLDAATKEKQKEIQQRQDNEDLSQTCFIRGLSYDVNEAEFTDFLKKNVGEIVYVKLVKFKADAAKHNGNGFVKFKDRKVVDRLIEMTEQFNKGEYVPKPKDPKFELGGIRLQFYPALKKTDAASLKVQREQELAAKDNPEDKKKRHNKKMTMEEVIAADKQGKRRLAFTKSGFNDITDKVKLGEVDREQRKRHQEEKMIKMKNPNYLVSEKRVVLKNINRLLTDQQLKLLATDVLKSKMSEKEIKKAKIFSDVRLIESRSEESTGKSSVRLNDIGHRLHRIL
jgi:RNA recognition motif-containing protein